MHIFVEQIVNGLVNGCIYALIAIGLTMVYGILHVINLAHGEIFMIGAFVAYACYTLTGSYAVAIVGAILATAFVGLLIERLVFRPLARQARINTLIASVGLSLVLSNAALVLSHGTPHFYLTPLSGQIVHVGFLSHRTAYSHRGSDSCIDWSVDRLLSVVAAGQGAARCGPGS